MTPVETPIFDIISKFVELRPSGKHHVGLCPFHEEKTPSFFVFKSRFKCFGCGVSGDAIEFIMRVQNVPFLEAVGRLGGKSIKPYEFVRMTEKRKMVDAFREWEAIYIDELTILIRAIKKILKASASELFDAKPDFLSFLLDSLNIYMYYYNILLSKDDAIKYELYKNKGPRNHSPHRIFENTSFLQGLI